ncbi:MAG: aspartate aminotransferase family protein [Verrucomicrobia bacterium]|nr:aspartate aminotransferase family protein [Verrucomicrobiota bacterium]
MTTAEIVALFNNHVMPTYGRSLTIVRGKGSKCWDADGKEYLDFGGGVAVNILGHSHPAVVRALKQQASQLIHCSNLYYSEPQGLLAKKIVELTGADGKCFFCNSGAEANEALYKLARKFGHDEGRFEILTMEGSFHGRTLAGIAATGQDKVKKGFEPMMTGFKYASFNNLDSVRAAVGPQTAAILVEPVQGESGIRPATPEFLRGLRQLCNEKNLLLMFDEVQCGNGRTGKFFGFQSIAPDVVPDAFSMAKGIGGGFPIGAIWSSAARKVKTADGEKSLCDILGPGTHASTFGGTPLACAVALAVIRTVEEKKLMAKAAARSKRLKRGLKALQAKFKCIKEVRGLGLMLGIELDHEVKDVVAQCAAAGLLIIPAGTHTFRFVPPLTISNADAEAALAIVEKVLEQP